MNEENKNANNTEDEIELPETPVAPAENKASETQTAAAVTTTAVTIKGVYEWLETFCLALSLMVILFLFAFKYVTVDGTSMLDTLDDGQKLIITDLTSYEQGDIVVICEPGHEKPLVKRIIAVEGQTVDIDFETWTVYVDGKAIDEPYVRYIYGADMKSDGFSGHIVVEEGTVFVMGDNRNGSTDSRKLGCIDKRNILGKVVFRVFPLNVFGKVK
ncbi:MAG: signal peptidase I [Eubacteriales bacterium]|nr:signal peptidase I [Eubacteriales bacterium]